MAESWCGSAGTSWLSSNTKSKCTNWEGLSRRDIDTVAKLAGMELGKAKLSWKVSYGKGFSGYIHNKKSTEKI